MYLNADFAKSHIMILNACLLHKTHGNTEFFNASMFQQTSMFQQPTTVMLCDISCRC